MTSNILSGSTPSKTDYTLPTAFVTAFAASSSSQWVVGNNFGVVFDGASSPSTPRYLAQDQVWSIAGSSGSVAISTSIGTILVFDPYPAALQETINSSNGKLALSTDGGVLGAFANINLGNDETLNFYSLPSGNVIQSFPNTTGSSPVLTYFTLAASGGTIGRSLLPCYHCYSRQVTPIAGTPVIWSDSGSTLLIGLIPPPISLSPDGTLVAVYNAPRSSTSVTSIYKNGTLVTAVPGAVVGWIDNARLLVNQYGANGCLGCTIYSSAGAALATPSLPELQSIQTVNSDSVYDPVSNEIHSRTTSQPTWTASYPSSSVGAVSGAYVVYESGHSVVVESY